MRPQSSEDEPEEMKMLQLLQHQQLSKIVQEQAARMTGGEGPKAADFATLHKGG